MLKIASVLVGVSIGLALTSRVASAQLVNGRWQRTPQPNGTRAVERPPQQTVFFVTPTPQLQHLHHRQIHRFPVAQQLVPVILMSDGSILANFGFGYEPVVRPCGNFASVSGTTFTVDASGALSTGTPYVQPVPNQLTPSQLNVQSMQSGRMVVSSAAQAACFSQDATGRLFVVR